MCALVHGMRKRARAHTRVCVNRCHRRLLAPAMMKQTGCVLNRGAQAMCLDALGLGTCTAALQQQHPRLRTVYGDRPNSHSWWVCEVVCMPSARCIPTLPACRGMLGTHGHGTPPACATALGGGVGILGRCRVGLTVPALLLSCARACVQGHAGHQRPGHAGA